MQKTKYFFSLLLPLFTLITINDTAFSQGWEKTYGGAKDDVANDLIKTSDGGFVAVGSTNSFGMGGTDVFIIKINSSGTLKWTKVFGGANDDAAYSVAEASNGDLLIAGVTASFGAGGKDVYLIKLNAAGSLKWTKTYGGAGDDEARSVKIAGSKYFIGGTSAGNFYLIKTDVSGIANWQKYYGTPSAETCYDMVKTYDNGIALSGYTAGYGFNHTYIVKTNSNGDSLFTRNYNTGSSSPGATGIAETTDHGLVMTGLNYSGSGYGDLFLLKVNNTGSQVYNLIGTALANQGNRLCSTNDGGVIVVGGHCNFGCTMELLKYDLNGIEQWHKTSYQYAIFNSYNTFSWGSAIIKTGNTGYVACGYSKLPSGSTSDFLIVKTDTAGTTFAASTLSASGPTSFCAPGSVTLTASAGFSSYQWCYVNTSHALTYIAAATNPSYSASATGYYSCLMKSQNNDLKIASSYVNVLPSSPATITPSGPLSYCASLGQTLTLSATPGTGYSCQWKLNNLDLPGINYINYVPTQSGSYTVNMSNACINSTSGATVVNLNATPPAPVISYGGFSNPAIYQCNNGSSNYDGYMQVTALSNATYQWYHNGAIMNGSTNSTLFPYYNNENYTCQVTTPCGSATSASFPGGYTTWPPNNFNQISTDGPAFGCGVVSVHMHSPQSPAYQWYLNGNAIPGANADDYIGTTSGNYTCNYDEYLCGQTTSDALQIIISASPAAAINASGPTSVCSGTVTLNALPTGAGITYNWIKENISVSTASSYVATSTANYRCIISQPACGTSTSNIIYVSIGLPADTIINATATTICSSSASTLSIVGGLSPGQTAQWKLNNVYISGATAGSYIASLAGNYKCAITNSCGTVNTNTIALVVNPIPAAIITGNTILCPGGNVALTETAGTGSSYQWYNNNSLIGGATQQTYNATVATLYKIRVTAANGCTTFSNVITLTAGAVPIPAVSASHYPDICKGDTVQLRTPIGTGYSYQWKRNGGNINGANSYFYSVADSGYYSVAVSNTCGTGNAASPYYIRLKSKPAATVTAQGPTTFCNGDSVVLTANVNTGLYYSWLKNGTAVSGATGSSWSAKTSGTYKVLVTNSSGCPGTSSGIIVSVPCRVGNLAEPFPGELSASLYPNPFTETITLFVADKQNEMYLVTIKDLYGRAVSSTIKVAGGSEMQLGKNLSAGFYLVEILSEEKHKILRVEKME